MCIGSDPNRRIISEFGESRRIDEVRGVIDNVAVPIVALPRQRIGHVRIGRQHGCVNSAPPLFDKLFPKCRALTNRQDAFRDKSFFVTPCQAR